MVTGRPDAPAVVGVAGLGCSHRYFRPFARAMAGNARVAVPDLPGFGCTPGPPDALGVRGLSLALADWLRVTGRGGSVLVANSLGCQVVIDLAVHAPELLGPVVLIGPTIDPHARRAGRQLARLALAGLRERRVLVPVIARDYLVDAGPRRLLATFRHALADAPEEKAPFLRTRAVVVRGTRDPLVPARWARELVAALPRGQLIEVGGHAHAVHHSAPERLAALTRPLLPP